MFHLVENLQFKADIDFVTKDSACFKSLDYPPKDDFVMSINREGDVISRYGDDTWNFNSFGLAQKFQFKEYDKTNKALFKQLMYYLIYSHLFPGKYHSLIAWYKSYQNIFRACSSNKINANELSRFPKIVEAMAQSYSETSPSNFKKSIWHYHALLKHQDQIGFKLLNEQSITKFKQFEPSYEFGQTAYIPNRIWTKFIQYLNSVLDDFEACQKNLESCYDYLVQTSSLNESKGILPKFSSPFNKKILKDKIYYDGSFDDFLNANDLMELFEKYCERPQDSRFKYYKIDQLGSLLNNIMVVCYLYILYYSFMRRNEALSLRLDCLRIESDDQTGEFYLLVGETTKTDPDSDDRWIIPKPVERAVRVAKTLLKWKLKYIAPVDENPYLFQNMSVWREAYRKSEVRPMKSFDNLLIKALYFYKPEQFLINHDDYNEAIALTPSLIRQDWFKVGRVWNFAFHQFRRTLAIHFALNKVSASSTQFQMKHGTREQQFHYQNNAGRLRLSHLAEEEVVNEYYAEMARNIISVVENEHVLPHKHSPIKQNVVNFVKGGDMKKLLKAQKNGSVGYRKNILGGCMKQGTCEYGGFDTIAHCAGGESGNMCSDLIIDGNREQEFREDKAYYESQMDDTHEDFPKQKALKAEVLGYERVLEVIERKKTFNNE